MTQDEKARALEILARRLDEQRAQVLRVEARLLEYYEGLIREPEVHNGYEVLCAIKLLRLMRMYEVDADEVQRTIYVFEGEWGKDAKGIWRHHQGGVKQPGRQGPEVYRFEPFQVFVFTAVYGVKVWIDTELTTADRYPTNTERVTADGRIEDLRRMCVRFICFMPRKTNKTGLAALIGTHDFMLGDDDAMAVCCANSQDQSKILYKRLQLLIGQFDPQGKRIRSTATETNWRPGQMRSASAYAMSAGGKTKDGLFASLCLADEYGSAGYTNGSSDMGNLVKVIESSMGPRREGLTFITTTAGNIQTGPFIELLSATRTGLINEIKYDSGEELPTVANDRWMCLLLQPDDWETEDEVLFTDRNIRRKVNPMLGKIVQHSFYEQAISDSRLDPITKQETITKLFNVYRGMRVTTWLTGDRIRPRQVARRITDCKYADGWNIFVGLDFSQGDDLFAMDLLAINYRHDAPANEKMFADTICWIVEKSLKDSPNRQLYELWIKQGWLHICPGEVFNPDYPINELMALNQKGLNLVMFAYDPAQSIQPINTIKAWLQSLGIDAQTIKQMVVPVPQTFYNQNGLIQKVEWLLLGQEFNTDTGGWSYTTDTPFLYLSANPLWPWCFGNCKIETSSSELRAVRKSNQHSKIDPVHALFDALYAFDLSEGMIQQQR